MAMGQSGNIACASGPMCIVYALVLSVGGVVLSVAHFLSSHEDDKGQYLSIFHIFLYGTSILFLFYVSISVLVRKGQSGGGEDVSGSRDTLDSLEGPRGVLDGPRSPLDGPRVTLGEGEEGEEEEEEADKTPENINFMKDDLEERKAPSYTYHGEGLSLFLRVAVIVFGMGSVILDGFRLLQFTEKVQWPCQGKIFMTQSILRIIFVFCQIFFIFKYHKILINFHQGFVRLGLLHLVATNVNIWVFTVALETTESYSHALMNTFGFETDENTIPSNGYTPNLSLLATCNWDSSLASKASPYLYPCVVQFAIIAAAASLSIYRHVGCTVVEHTSQAQTRHPRSICHKANSGLFLGLPILAATCVTACFFLMFEKSKHPLNNKITMFVFVVTKASLLAFASVATLIAFLRLRKFERSPVRPRFNRNVLTLSIVGFFALSVCLLLPCTQNIKEGSGTSGLYTRFQMAISLLSIIQATAQFMFISDACSRVAADRHQRQTKPGRSVLTFLLILNLSIWVVNSLELKEIHTYNLYRGFYGELAWQIIMHICLPLTILFRFQSTVCISDIWFKAYKRNHAVPRFTRIFDPDSSL